MLVNSMGSPLADWGPAIRNEEVRKSPVYLRVQVY